MICENIESACILKSAYIPLSQIDSHPVWLYNIKVKNDRVKNTWMNLDGDSCETITS